MLDVLVPVEHDTVVRSLEMCLAQQMVHRIVVEQLRTRTRQAGITPYLEQVMLAAAGPNDALYDLAVGAAVEHEKRSAVQRGFL